MKLLIATDMEGISGVVHWDHVTPGHDEWQRFRKIMTHEVNAAVAGAAAGGADEILVMDGHWNSTNILIEELDSRARLVCGTPSPLSMVEGVQTGVQAALFIGYHACMGTPNAILDHTWSSSRVSNVWLNGNLVGEFALNAAVCGQFGAPVLMVSGDQAVCNEASAYFFPLEKVVVKTASSRHAAECLPPSLTHPMIQAAAERAVFNFLAGGGPRPIITAQPVDMALEFIYSDMVDRALVMPGIRRVSGRTIALTAPDMVEAYRVLRAAITLANRG